MLSLGLCECPQHLAGYLWLKPSTHSNSRVPSAPACPAAVGLRWFSGAALLSSSLLLLLCLAPLLGLCTCFAFLHGLPVWLVTFPEG